MVPIWRGSHIVNFYGAIHLACRGGNESYLIPDGVEKFGDRANLCESSSFEVSVVACYAVSVSHIRSNHRLRQPSAGNTVAT